MQGSGAVQVLTSPGTGNILLRTRRLEA